MAAEPLVAAAKTVAVETDDAFLLHIFAIGFAVTLAVSLLLAVIWARYDDKAAGEWSAAIAFVAMGVGTMLAMGVIAVVSW